MIAVTAPGMKETGLQPAIGFCNPFSADCWTKPIKAIAGDAWTDIVKSFLSSMVACLEKMSTFWISVPDPKIMDGGKYSAALEVLNNHLAPFCALCSLISIAWSCIMAVRRTDAKEFVKLGEQLVQIGFTQVALGAVVQLFLTFSNSFSKWVLTLAKAGDLSGLLSVKDALGDQNLLALFFIEGILGILGALAQLLFIVARGPLILAMVLAMHFFAATAANEEGRLRFSKGAGLLTSFILFKPVGAVIYSLSFMLIYGTGGDKGVKGKDVLMNSLYGFAGVLLAALALPATIRFIVPLAAKAASSMFSGAAMVGAAVAGGAAIATMGGSAAAGGSAAGGAKAAKGAQATQSTSNAGQQGGGPQAPGGTGKGGGTPPSWGGDPNNPYAGPDTPKGGDSQGESPAPDGASETGGESESGSAPSGGVPEGSDSSGEESGAGEQAARDTTPAPGGADEQRSGEQSQQTRTGAGDTGQQPSGQPADSAGAGQRADAPEGGDQQPQRQQHRPGSTPDGGTTRPPQGVRPGGAKPAQPAGSVGPKRRLPSWAQGARGAGGAGRRVSDDLVPEES